MTTADTNHLHYTLRDLLRRYRELASIEDVTGTLDAADAVATIAEQLDAALSAGVELPEAWRWERHPRGISARGRSAYEHGSAKASLKPPSPCIVHTGWDTHPETPYPTAEFPAGELAGRTSIQPGKWYRDHTAQQLTDEHNRRRIPIPTHADDVDDVDALADSLVADDRAREHACTRQVYSCTTCDGKFDSPEGTSAPVAPYPAGELRAGSDEPDAIAGILRIRMMSDNQVLRLMCDTDHRTGEHRAVMALSALGTMRPEWPLLIAARVARSRDLIDNDEYERRTT